MSNDQARITVPGFMAMKAAGQKISMLTAYDFSMARLLDEAGIDALLVGDSLAMVVQGHETTLPVTLDEMIYHAKLVGRAVRHALTIVDLPFPTYHVGRRRAIEAAGRVLKETRCQAVKLEGSADQAEVIQALVGAGIPVMAHCGLRPQNVHVLGGYRVQRQREQLLTDARAAEQAGAFGVVLECVPAEVAEAITSELKIPTIGIGAGNRCDGQVLVVNDLLGMTTTYMPRFVKCYADLKTTISAAVGRYREEVQNRQFPGPEQTFK